MKLLILPGFSPKNKEWAEECSEFLKDDFEVTVHEWKHWETGDNEDFSFKAEIEKVKKYFDSERCCVLAKSIGTLISAVVLSEKMDKTDKIIFCGIPLKGNDEEGNGYYHKFFKLSDVNKFLCFQNTNDPWGSFKEVSEFVKEANPSLKIIEKDREDHNYPFYEEFRKFLT